MTVRTTQYVEVVQEQNVNETLGVDEDDIKQEPSQPNYILIQNNKI